MDGITINPTITDLINTPDPFFNIQPCNQFYATGDIIDKMPIMLITRYEYNSSTNQATITAVKITELEKIK